MGPLSGTPTGQPPPRRRRRLVRLAAWIAAALLLLAVAAAVLVHTPPAKRYVLALVADALARQDIALTARRLDYNLLTLSLALDEATLGARVRPEAPPFARVDRLTLDVSLLDLIRGRYVVQDGAVIRPEIHLAVDRDGRDNLPAPAPDPDAPTDEEPTQLPDLLVSAFRIVDARVRYQDARHGLDVVLPIPAITVEGARATGRHTVRLEARDGVVAAEDRRVAIERVDGELSVEPDLVAVRRFELVVAGSTIALSGDVRHLADPRLDLALSANLDVAALAALADVEEPIGGTLEVRATARGPVEAMALEASLAGEALRIRDLEDLNLDVAAAYRTDTGDARLDRLALVSPVATIHGEGALALGEPVGESRVEARVRSVDVERIARTFDAPYSLASLVDADIRASWPALDFERASGDARATFQPTRQDASAGVVPLAGGLDVRAAPAAAGGPSLITVELRRLQALDSTIDGQVSLSDQEALGGAVSVRVSDLGRLVPAVEAFLGEDPGALVGTPVGGPLEVDARLGGTIEAPAIDAEVAAPALAVGDVAGIAARAEARYTPAEVLVRRAEVAWQEARLHAAGRLGLDEPQPVDLQLELEAVEIDAVLAALELTDVPARGAVSASAAASGTVGDPRVTLALQGTDLAAYGETLGDLRLDAGLLGQRLEIARLRLDKPQPDGDATIDASGGYHLDTGEYTLQLETDGLRLSSLTLPDDMPVRGAMALSAEGRGTLARPAATFELTIDELDVGGHAFGAGRLTAEIADERATLRARADAFRLDANAEIGTAEPYPARFAAVVDLLDLATLPLDPELPLAGQVRARATGTGDLADLVEASASATIDHLALSWDGQPIEADGPIEIRYADRHLAIDRLVVRALDSTVSVNGLLPLDLEREPGVVHIDARANLATLAQYAPADAEVSARGDLALEGTITGSLQAIDPVLTLTVQDAEVSAADLEPAISDVAIRVAVENGVLTVDQLQAAWGGARLEGAGRLPFGLLPDDLPVALPRQPGPAQATLRLDGLDLGELPGAPAELSGAMALGFEAEAPSADLEALTARLWFPELTIDLDGFTLAQQGTSSLVVRQGVARVEQFHLAGSVGQIQLGGGVGLVDPRPIDASVEGTLDVAFLSTLVDGLVAEGSATLQVAATGSAAEPALNGFVELADATVRLAEPRVAVDPLSARVDLTPTRATLTSLDGMLNGGAIAGEGWVELAEGGIADVSLRLTAEEVAFDEPMGLQSLSNADLVIRQRGELIVLGGQVTILEAGLTDPINLDTGLFAALTAPRRLDLTEERNPLVERLRFDVTIDTDTPIYVDNNLARAEMEADLRLLGTPYDTGMSGRLTIQEESELILAERRYVVERGIITFTNDLRIEPMLDLLITTTADRYDVTLEITGTPEDTETVLTSDPALAEPDIVALLVTGRTLDDMRGEEFEVAQRQMLSLLSGRLGTGLGRTLERATGLSMVRLEPHLIADETNPGARLTIGQDITSSLSLVYSTDLADSGDRIWIAEYDVTRQFDTRAVRAEDSYRFDFRHDVRFGGLPEPSRMARTRRTIRSIAVEDATRDAASAAAGVDEAEVRARFRVRPGDRYDYFKARREVERVEAMYAERRMLAARVRLSRVVDGDEVDLALRIAPGPTVDLVYEGYDPPSGLARDIREIWRRGVFDTQRAEDALAAIHARLVGDRYLDPTLEYAIEAPTPSSQRVVLRVDPGTRFDRVQLAFEGAGGIPPGDLEAVVHSQRLGREVFTHPRAVTDLLERFYQEEGYLTAELDAPRYEFDEAERLARVVIPVQEGPRYVIRRIAVTGATAYAEDVLRGVMPLATGDPFLPMTAERSLARVRELYWQIGYNEMTAAYAFGLDPEAGRVDVEVEIREGPRARVADIQVQGTAVTSEELVRDELEIVPGGPLDLTAVGRSRRNLYNTRAYAIADISYDVLDGEADAPTAEPGQTKAAAVDEADDTAAPGAERPMRVNVAVREVQPYQIRYGAFFDTERGPGGIVDVSNHSSLGRARVVGIRTRYDARQREVRLYATQPMLRPLPFSTSANLYYRQERNPIADPQIMDADRFGLSIQQERRLWERWLWSYGYRFERSRVWNPAVTPRDTTVENVAPLTSSLIRETRDDPIDASRGAFLSHAFSFSPGFLGSDAHYVKYFGQFFKYYPLEPTKRERFTGEILRPRFVYAVGLRLGLAHGFGGEGLPLSERFFAGGSTTLRGFPEGSLGPIGPDDEALGGEATFIVNNEVRVPLIGMFDGVGFVDIGNVYPRLGDFTLRDVRGTTGVGLRVRTPWFLVRADYGVPLNPRRPNEEGGRFFFSIGQAF